MSQSRAVKVPPGTMVNGREILFVSRNTPGDEIRRLLLTRGFPITVVNNVGAASQVIGQTKFVAMVVDLGFGPDALSLLRWVRAGEQTRVLSVLAIGEWGTGVPTVALTAGADGYEPAPLDADRLVGSIERILTKRVLAAGANE